MSPSLSVAIKNMRIKGEIDLTFNVDDEDLQAGTIDAEKPELFFVRIWKVTVGVFVKGIISISDWAVLIR